MMGYASIIAILFLYVFSLLVFTPQLNILPYWITSNYNLYILTILLWNFGVIIVIIKWGFN